MTYSNKTLNNILTHNKFGSGNFLYAIQDKIENLDQISIYLDEEITLPGNTSSLTLSINQLITLSNCWAAWYENQGVTPKDPVSLYFEDNIQYFIHYLALTRIGAIPVLVNGSLDPEIIKIFIERMSSKLLICSDSKKLTLEKTINTSSNNDSISIISADKVSFDNEIQPKYIHIHQPNDPVLLGHTSGTTGIPKGVQFNHYGFIYGVKKQLTKQVGNRIMSALPHSHASAISILMSSLLRGAIVKIQQRKDAIELFQDISSFKPDLFVSFPKVYVDLCRHDLDNYDLSSIGYWLSTGDANHEPHIRKLIAQGNHEYKGQKKQGSIFIDNLGSSEFGFAAFRNLHSMSTDHYNRRIGKPFDWVDVAILSEQGEALGANTIGLLGVQSDTVTSGYWNNSLLSEKNRLGGYWLTGDLAYKDSNDVYFHVDRTTDSITTKNGILYSCLAEELVLRNFSDIFDCSIFATATDDQFSEAAIEVELLSNVNLDSLLSDINQTLSENDMPLLTRITENSSTSNTGVTGKKLKRVMRDSLDIAS